MPDKTVETIIIPKDKRTGAQLRVSFEGEPKGVLLPLFIGVGNPDNKKMLNDGQPISLAHAFFCPLPDEELRTSDEAVVTATIPLMQPAEKTGQLVFNATLTIAGKEYPLQMTFQMKAGQPAGWIDFAWWLEVV